MLRSSLAKDKKGQWGVPIATLDGSSYILVVLTITIGIIVAGTESNQVQDTIDSLDIGDRSGYLMQNILNTKIDDKNIGELAALWYTDDEYEESLSLSLSSAIADYYGQEVSWLIEIGGKKLGNTLKTKIYESDIRLPLYDGSSELLKLSIYLDKIKEGSMCFNPFKEACSTLGRLCYCDRVGYKFIWTNCVTCDCEDGICK